MGKAYKPSFFSVRNDMYVNFNDKTGAKTSTASPGIRPSSKKTTESSGSMTGRAVSVDATAPSSHDNMNPENILGNKEELIQSIPVVRQYLKKFRDINKQWAIAITSGKIETGHLETEASQVFIPLLEDMGTTKEKYSKIQERLVDAILFEMVKKVVREINDTAKFAINILKRNLFERTADVGYLATDTEIVDFLRRCQDREGNELSVSEMEDIRQRLIDYQYEYTVYDEILVLDTLGEVQTNFDESSRVSHSKDPLLSQTQAIDLHQRLDEDKYIETYRKTDLRPRQGSALMYSQKIEDASVQESCGTLCLSFDIDDEMERIFSDLRQGNPQIVIALLDDRGRIMNSNSSILPYGSRVSVDVDAEFRFLTFSGKTYLATMVETDGYQGFFGLPWYALAMIDIAEGFKTVNTEQDEGTSHNQKLQNFSEELTVIKKDSEELLDDMKVDSINGRVQASKFGAKAFVEILQFVKQIGEEIDDLFTAAVLNLQNTIVTSFFNDIQFRAFQGNNIADRNLYERANDVCWWALTPLFRQLLAKNINLPISESEQQALTSNLQYINDLYTPYLRLVLADPKGNVVAVSDPPDGIEERFVEDGLPTGQDFVGTYLESGLIKKAIGLSSSRDYCVSDFIPSPLYGGRPTYIYSTAVRDPQNARKVVGVVQIVFDAEPQFHAMLSDILPKDEQKQIQAGCFGIFVNRSKTIISSTAPEYPPGTKLPLEDSCFKYNNGERASVVAELAGQSYAVGLQVSEGYREYKKGDGYTNDVVCMIFVPV